MKYLVLIFLAVRCIIFASAYDRQEVGIDGLTNFQRNIYCEAVQVCMAALNQNCRYPTPDNLEYHLPVGYFQCGDHPKAGPFCMAFKPEIEDFSAALDSIFLPLGNENKYVIDCSFAVAFSKLYGIRSVLNDKELFNRYCCFLFAKNKSINLNGHLKDGHFLERLPEIRSREVIKGTMVYVEQLSEDDDFESSLLQNVRFNQIKGQLGCSDRSPYEVKHRFMCDPGLNGICVDEDKYVFFAPPQVKQPVSLEKTAQFLIDGMNAALTKKEFELEVKARGFCPVSLYAILNSIKYKDNALALQKIIGAKKGGFIDFRKVFSDVEKISKLMLLQKR